MTVTPPEPMDDGLPPATENPENISKFFFLDFLHKSVESYGREQVSEWLLEFQKE